MLNHYILYAENRPLLHLRRMVDDPNFDFTKSDYEHQFKEFYNKLERLVEADEECRGKVELFRYHTVTFYATLASMLNLLDQGPCQANKAFNILASCSVHQNL